MSRIPVANFLDFAEQARYGGQGALCVGHDMFDWIVNCAIGALPNATELMLEAAPSVLWHKLSVVSTMPPKEAQLGKWTWFLDDIVVASVLPNIPRQPTLAELILARRKRRIIRGVEVPPKKETSRVKRSKTGNVDRKRVSRKRSPDRQSAAPVPARSPGPPVRTLGLCQKRLQRGSH